MKSPTITGLSQDEEVGVLRLKERPETTKFRQNDTQSINPNSSLYYPPNSACTWLPYYPRGSLYYRLPADTGPRSYLAS